MKKDIGFWNEQGEYIEDIQEVTMAEEIELLRQENAELKAENKRLMKQFDIEKLTNKEAGLSIYRSNKELMFREFEQNVSKKLIKYLNTMQEIKDLLKSQVWRIGDDKTIEQILQKISDCEV